MGAIGRVKGLAGYTPLTPSCGGHVPTTERTLDPAATDGELDIRLAIKERKRYDAIIPLTYEATMPILIEGIGGF